MAALSHITNRRHISSLLTCLPSRQSIGCSIAVQCNNIRKGDQMYVEEGLNKQVFELFLKFSRLEYALSRVNGFARGTDGGPVYGDWKKLAERLGTEFFDKQKTDPEKTILWNAPPGRWIVTFDASENLVPEWRARQAPVELRLSFEPVLWVRNCVIHGESQDMVPRYEQLVTAAVNVLESSVEACIERADLMEIAARYTEARIQEPPH